MARVISGVGSGCGVGWHNELNVLFNWCSLYRWRRGNRPGVRPRRQNRIHLPAPEPCHPTTFQREQARELGNWQIKAVTLPGTRHGLFDNGDTILFGSFKLRGFHAPEWHCAA